MGFCGSFVLVCGFLWVFARALSVWATGTGCLCGSWGSCWVITFHEWLTPDLFYIDEKKKIIKRWKKIFKVPNGRKFVSATKIQPMMFEQTQGEDFFKQLFFLYIMTSWYFTNHRRSKQYTNTWLVLLQCIFNIYSCEKDRKCS